MTKIVFKTKDSEGNKLNHNAAHLIYLDLIASGDIHDENVIRGENYLQTEDVELVGVIKYLAKANNFEIESVENNNP